ARWCPASGKSTWRLGTITHKFGKLHYHVNLDGESYCLKRHYNQLLRVTVNYPQPKKVTIYTLALPMDEPDQLQPKLAEPPDWLQPEPAEVPEVQPFPQPIPKRLARARRASRKLQD
ncbi:hypothetical protein ILUMI_18298, partial [Ignelater luminosus]